ncbi:UbiA family prenyltransferase [Lactobacillus acetotolerans]|uniref:UbiA family prenyltransferase n=1 Tax=Lactobacillus acetotolerans TaxID=1600 RepID=UPI0014515DC9|nr:UbiA family prenyltransferase [Lactobacillus acetotolerans]QJD72922.1 UbiA family prenyltransferase [Lactobacillus acetotolerans]
MERTQKYNRMTLTDFFELVRLNTKLNSLMPYLIGILFTYYFFHTFNWQNSLIYLVAQGAIALFVTGFNNVQDYRLAKSNDFKKNHNVIGKNKLSPRTAMDVMLPLLLIASILGIWLTVRTNWFILLIGIPGLLTSVFYTYGPVPFSRTPIGELLAGLFEGFGITFLTVYINAPIKEIATLNFNWPAFSLNGNLQNLLIIFLISLPEVFFNAATMLADNTCDLKADLQNGRHTLPSYIGVKNSLRLFAYLTLGTYVTVTIAVILRVLPIWQLLVFITLPKLIKNVKAFNAKQTKDMTFWVDKNNKKHHIPTTFDLAPQNLSLFQAMQVIGLILGILI